MTEVLASSAPESRLLGTNASFNFSSSSKSGGSLRGQVQLLRWKYLPNEDQRARLTSILPLKRPTVFTNRRGSAGLTNLGNTCFMNSVLQCLSHAKPLFNYCANGDYMLDINPSSSMGGSLVTAFARLTEMLCNGENFVSPADFKSQIDRFASQYIGDSQQDAQEFLICLLEGLHEDLNRAAASKSGTSSDNVHPGDAKQQLKQKSTEDSESKFVSSESEQWRRCLPKSCDSRITDLFVGVLRSTLTCQVCKHVSESLEPFIDLSLPVDCCSSATSLAKKSTSDEVNLLDCLQLLVQQETLDADNRPECERCKQRRTSTKSFSIDRFPPILILHLKRFKHSDNHMTKVETDVKCPLYKLDLTRYSTDTSNTSAVYNLFAVCNHSGSPTNGHYTTSARQLVDDTWSYFDDARVSSIAGTAVVTSDAYILFYELSETTSSRL